MKLLVTGVAGFIGSHLARRLVDEGHFVVGIDCFTDYYALPLKRQNMVELARQERFKFVQDDLMTADLPAILSGVDAVMHQAAQPGVRASWGQQFAVYVRDNILVTQRLLEAARGVRLRKFVFASSSSIYGDAEASPTPETSAPLPVSPYGVSKLAAEHLCYLYWKNFGIPTVSLRYFTVYGPRQRPDMAFHRFMRAILTGEELLVNGDGEQSRDFTFISDVVQANLQALEGDITGQSFNIGNGSPVTIRQVIGILEEIIGKSARVRHAPTPEGDVRHTSADIGKAKKLLGYQPQVRLKDGLARQLDWTQQALQDDLLPNPSK